MSFAYRKLYEEQLEDIEGIGTVYVHERTGAHVCVIRNQDVQKCFQIAFRTAPTDDTGVAHIVEHAVFCGSERFPVKDIFAECEKGSVKTFLNAMTCSDMTVYPVASCNEKDFRNLVNLYLDSVFHPLMHRKEEIFLQEGWRYELESPEDLMAVNGIVYNEMLGAFAYAPERMSYAVNQQLFEGSCYAFESGGYPKCIPELTYEDFCAFHREHYHPSNAYIYLYGDLDFEELLTWVDEEYLSHYEQREVPEAQLLTSIEGGLTFAEVEIPADAEADGPQGAYSYSVLYGTPLDLENSVAMEVLTEVLIDASGAPIKKAILDSGIGQTVSGSFGYDSLQGCWSVEVMQAENGRAQELYQIISETAERLCQEGIDHDSLKASLRSMEFTLREAEYDYPPGIVYGLRVMNTWLYEEDKAFLWLKRLNVYRKLMKEIENGYFERLLREVVLDLRKSVLVEMKPVEGLDEQEQLQEEEQLAAIQASMSDEELQSLIEKNIRLENYQQEGDSEEALASLPQLHLSDLEDKSVTLSNVERYVGAQKLLWHTFPANGIIYFKAHIPLKELTPQECFLLGLVCSILGGMPTKQHSYDELSIRARMYTGGVSIFPETFSKKDAPADFTAMLTMGFRALEGEFENGLKLLREIVTETNYHDKKRLRELLNQMAARMKNEFTYESAYYARKRAMSYYDPQQAFLECTSGIYFYEQLRSCVNTFEQKFEQLADSLCWILRSVFSGAEVVYDVTAGEDGCAEAMNGLAGFAETLRETVPGERPVLILSEQKSAAVNEAFALPVSLQYTAFGGSFVKAGYSFRGALDVAKNLLNADYLYQTLRIRGGAYGFGMRIYTVSGHLLFYSMDDPNCRESFAAMEMAADYLEQLEMSDEELERYIIGTIGLEDIPLSPRQMGNESFNCYMNNLSEEDHRKERAEILGTTVEQLRECGQLIRGALQDGYRCCLGNEKKLRQNRELFSVIRRIH